MRRGLASRADPFGKFTPESVYNAYKCLDFNQKKGPSPTLTWFAWTVLQGTRALDPPRSGVYNMRVWLV